MYEYLVIDSGCLIKNKLIDFESKSSKFVTCSSVLSEIKDATSRQNLKLLPFELEVREPSDQAIKAVTTFARKTGDLAVLSVIDIKVLALTYMMEKEVMGSIEHIPTEPNQAKSHNGQVAEGRVVLPVESKKKNNKNNTITFSEDEFESEPEDGQKNDEVDELTEKLEDISVEPMTVLKSELAEECEVEKLAEVIEQALQEDKVEDESEIDIDSKTNNVEQEKLDDEDGEADEVQETDDLDDDEGWITPSNLKLKQIESQMSQQLVEPRNYKVSCVTTDFAMQSVLLQMNLGCTSIEGLTITTIKSWVLRCHACYKITSNLNLQFCPYCGGPTLTRISQSIDSNGNVNYYLKSNYRYNLRGLRYTIPKLQGGHKNSDIILAADQEIYMKKLKYYEHRKEKDLLDPDYLPNLVVGKQNKQVIKPKVGYGRKNPNESKKRTGKKKRSPL